jgi:hypothetical protein
VHPPRTSSIARKAQRGGRIRGRAAQIGNLPAFASAARANAAHANAPVAR